MSNAILLTSNKEPLNVTPTMLLHQKIYAETANLQLV
jgi:hypothetical protein